MNSRKKTSKALRWLSGMLAVLTVSLVATFVYLEWQPTQSDWLSRGSIQKLHALNSEHQMVIDPLLDEHWYLQADLFQTNTLSLEEVERSNHQGLLVTLEESVLDQAFLVLQPAQPMSEQQLETLAELYKFAIPEFEAVEIDQNIQLEGSPHYWVLPENWVDLSEEEAVAVDSIETEVDTTLDTLPAPIRVGVIDSGVDARHEIFENVEILTGWNTITDDTIMYDDVGHGTHIAGILASESENLQIIPYKIVDSNGGRLSNVLEAFSKAIEDHPNVINASFGLMSSSYSLEVMMQEAYEEDIIVVAAAGNNNSSKGFYPATYHTTLAVASVTPEGEPMEKSNFGEWIDVAANGQMVLSALPDNQYGYKSGTSQAAATISARIVTLLQSEGIWNLENVISALQESRPQIEAGKLAGVAIVD